MCGESSSDNRATVVCNWSVGLSFTSMVEFKMYSLAFIFCGSVVKYVPGFPSTFVYAALELQSAHAELVNCFFHENTDTALIVNNTNITLSGNTGFKHHEGAIVASGSNLTFTRNTSFLDNGELFGQLSGGAICASYNTVLNFSGISRYGWCNLHFP